MLLPSLTFPSHLPTPWNISGQNLSFLKLNLVSFLRFFFLLEITYIGTIHPFHHEHAKAMLNAGKHVLCEKPHDTQLQTHQGPGGPGAREEPLPHGGLKQFFEFFKNNS